MKRLFAIALLGLVAFAGCNTDEGAAPANPPAGAGTSPAPADGGAAAPGDTTNP